MTGRVCFGDFVLDPETHELCRGGDPISLSPKAYQLLEILVANRPKALSKIALQERLWPDTFVVEKNLVNLIAEIRQSLGDDPTHPRFVRTVHRFGYAFQVPLAETPADNGTSRTAVRFRLLWANGHAWLGEGEHLLGRDPDLELFLGFPWYLPAARTDSDRRRRSDGRRPREQERNVRCRSVSRLSHLRQLEQLAAVTFSWPSDFALVSHCRSQERDLYRPNSEFCPVRIHRFATRAPVIIRISFRGTCGVISRTLHPGMWGNDVARVANGVHTDSS